jgi:hypothetical protein
VSAHIYVEGGGDSKELHARCREGFRKLLEQCGFDGRLPRLTACGGRTGVFSDFETAHDNKAVGDFVAMWLDSEEPLNDLDATLQHLKTRDGWNPPAGAVNDQVLFMTTCMETWIVADRVTLRVYYGSELRESALPPLVNLEQRERHEVLEKLISATRRCSNAYAKGKRSFEILGKLSPVILKKYLPSFVRTQGILDEHL